MCYILLSTCSTCIKTLQLRYALCSHALLHSFDPVACPNRMKRRQCHEGTLCGKCRRGSLSILPSILGVEVDELETDGKPIVLQRRGSEVQKDMNRERRRRRLVARRRGKFKEF
jgi:hypothetical protein